MFSVAVCCVGGWFLLRKPPLVNITNWPGGLVTREGDYTTSNGLTLRARTSDMLVRVSLLSASGRVLASNSKGSDFHRWFVHLDSKQRVWYYTGDLGIFVWSPHEDGTYSEAILESNSALCKEMPRSFYDLLGNAMQSKIPAPDTPE